MTVKYVDNNNQVVSDATVTKIEPIQNGINFLLTATSDIIIPVKNLIEVTNA